jgi:hypothetical protein
MDLQIKKVYQIKKKYSFDSSGISIGTETIFRRFKTQPKCS